jgi:two-component system copper resistance phosphate regulon response regulator CusR
VTALLIEDEQNIASYVARAFTGTGWEVKVVHDGREGFVTATSDPYDVIILDIGLPGKSGLEILRGIRERSIATPVLMLTAHSDVKDRISGLEQGADDYLAKPFAMEELLARVQALTRRSGVRPSPLRHVADLVMNETQRVVSRSGRTLHLSQREFDVLNFLVRHAGRPVTRTELCEHVWKSVLDQETNAVEVYIQRLRAKVDEDFPVKLIHTVRGIGYLFGEAAG